MSEEDRDIECPSKPSPSITDETASSPAAVTSSPPSTPSRRAPSPPRWRFVNEAKSTLGYSSLSAGQYVRGKSADELGAKYVPPNVSLYKTKEEKEKVGKLEIIEVKEIEEELPEGEYPGLPALEEQEKREPRKFREWLLTYDLPPRRIKDYVWCDGDVGDSYKIGDESSVESEREVGRLQPRTHEYTGDNSAGKYVLPKEDDMQDDSDDYWQMALDSSWQLSSHDPESEIVLQHETTNESSSASSSTETKILADAATEICIAEAKVEEKQEESRHDTKRCRYLMLVLLLLSVILLGALLGARSGNSTEKAAVAAIAFVAPNNSTDVPSSMPSSSPSSATPSSVPSSGCPVGMKEIYLGNSIPSIPNDDQNATWELHDSCSGEIVSRCMPCSLGTLVLGGENNRNMQIEILQPTSECISAGKEYSFHVYSTDDPDSCCGFDVASFYIRYSNELYPVPDDLLIQSTDGIDYTIYIGDREVPCHSEAPQTEISSSPSLWPTFQLTNDPSKSPTQKPSLAPTKSPSSPPTRSPVTNPPTKNPIEFIGGCPEHFMPLSYYTVGTQIETDGIVYECVSYSCGSYGFEPGNENSTLWQQGWAVIGRCDGTLAPSPRPTPLPTEFPTGTCTTKADFNLCLALDNSGSVCSFGFSDCLNCEPALFCQDNFFSFLPKESCCSNYVDMIEFSKLMVVALGQFEADKSFSVVQFATSAELVSNLTTAYETLVVLDNVRYTGGSTDHAAAIRQCQDSFSASDPSRQNFIMLITDGLPSSTVYLSPETVAIEEAAFVNGTGTFIIPIFISENYDAYAQSFMTSISSDGQVFDVTDYGSLDTLKDSLIEQVSCS